MVIAAFVPGNTPPLALSFIYKVIVEWANSYPQNQFYIISDADISPIPFNQKNIVTATVGLKHGLLYNSRLKNKMSVILTEKKASALISIDRPIGLSTIPQYSLIQALDKKINSRLLNRLEGIITLSKALKNELINKTGILEEKIQVVYGGTLSTRLSIDEGINTNTRDKFSEGKPFLLYRSTSDAQKNVIQLLKAFSLFKKRQKSSMKLLLLGKIEGTVENFDSLLNTYKFKEDVVYLTHLDEKEKENIMASAYAYISLSGPDAAFKLLEAANASIPIVAPHTSVLKELDEKMALFFADNDVTDLAEKMMLIYKDENLQARLSIKGKEISEKYTWAKTVRAMQELLDKQAND